jgi:hypothetical protein
MKITADLPDELVILAKKTAIDRKTTLRQLIEQGLQREIAPVGVTRKHPIDNLLKLDRSIWQGIDADQYVEDLRKDWS